MYLFGVIYNSLGFVFGHGCAEPLLDDQWVPANVTCDEELEAMGIPISTLGTDPEGVWCFGVPGMSLRLEGLPPFLDIVGPMFATSHRGMMDMVNRQWEQGRQAERYIEMKKKFYVPLLPQLRK